MFCMLLCIIVFVCAKYCFVVHYVHIAFIVFGTIGKHRMLGNIIPKLSIVNR